MTITGRRGDVCILNVWRCLRGYGRLLLPFPRPCWTLSLGRFPGYPSVIPERFRLNGAGARPTVPIYGGVLLRTIAGGWLWPVSVRPDGYVVTAGRHDC